MEGLERRVLPATVTWINPLGGDWDTASNWSSGQVPGPSDDAIINVPGATITHIFGTRDAVHSLTSQAAIALSAGSLSLAAPSLVNAALTVDDATLALAGLTADSLSVQDRGVLTSTGPITIDNALQLDDSQATLAGLTARLVQIQDGAALTSSGDATITGDTNVDGGSLSLTGTARLTTGNLRVFTGSSFTAANAVAVSGTCTFETGESLAVPLSVGRLLLGGVRFSSTANITVSSYAELDGATVTLYAPGQFTDFGQLEIHDGGSLVSSNPVLVSGTANLKDAGTVFTGDLQAQDVVIESGATLSVPSALSVQDVTSIAGGTLALTGAARLNTQNLYVTGGTLDAQPGCQIVVAVEARFSDSPGATGFTIGGAYNAPATKVSSCTVNFTGPEVQLGALETDAAAVVTIDTLDAANGFTCDGPGLVNVNDSLTVSRGAFLGVVGGTLNVQGNVTIGPNAGLVLKSGVLHVTGTLTLANTAALVIVPGDTADLASARIEVGGTARLDGTFLVDPGSQRLSSGQTFTVLSFGSQAGHFQNTYQAQPGQFYERTGPHDLSLVALNDPSQGGTPTLLPATELPFGTDLPGGIVYPLGPAPSRPVGVLVPSSGPDFHFVPATQRTEIAEANPGMSLAPVRSVPSNASSGGDVSDPGPQSAANVGSGADLKVDQPADSAASAPRPSADKLVLPAAADRFSEGEISRSLLLGTRATAQLLPGARGSSAGLVATFLTGDAEKGPARPVKSQPKDFPLTDCLIGVGTEPQPEAGGQKGPDGAPGPQAGERPAEPAARVPFRLARALEVSAGLLIASLLGTSLGLWTRRGPRDEPEDCDREEQGF
jgi:hypothetical protein